MDRKIVFLFIAVLLGIAMISIAAFAGRSGDTGSRGDMVMGSAPPSTLGNQWVRGGPSADELWRNMQSSGGMYSYSDSMLAMQHLWRMMSSYLANNSHRLSFNVSVSKAVINGTLSYLVNNIALVKVDQELYRIFVPAKLYDGEKSLSIQEFVFLGEIRKDDQLSIKAINISIISTKGDLVTSIYVATEIRDLSTGKTFTAILPLNIK